MDKIAIPEGYEDRLAAARAAAERLPEGPMRDHAVRVLSEAPTRERVAAAAEAAVRAGAIAAQLMGAGFDGTDAGRVVWLRLDYTGRLGSLALSPTVDRMSGKAVAKAIEAAWEAAEAARAEHVMRAERIGADLLARCAPDPRSADLREWVARSPERFTAGGGEDDVCEVEVTLAGRLTAFTFTVPNVTVDTEYEQLAAEASAVIGTAQQWAADRLAALVASTAR
ncbi:hypothetical protein [Glycomyces harbinensis]|uniref:Uncharacterized protein n=1 Tax=Glycomyces harbinensis TaxID=58114 RepID=A0A1G6WPH6_9ACTN|nr:hypothetical protein [Glycomyces harbinensis]SDD67772.1 hypothetical protein SAMN05216270_106148 [Glycomyces harbinensis]